MGSRAFRRWASNCAAIALVGALASCGSSPSTSGYGGTPRKPTPPVAYKVADPIGLAAVGTDVWAVSASTGTINRLAEGSITPTARVKVGDTPLRATYFHHLLWVTVFGAGQVVAVNPKTAKVVRRVALPGQPEGIVGAFGKLWVVRQAARKLTAISPNGAVGPSIDLGREPRLVTADPHSLYVSNFGAGTVTKVNPTTGSATTSNHLCAGTQGLADVKQTLWVTCTPGGKLLAVDPGRLKVTSSVEFSDEPDAATVFEGQVIVASTKGPTVHPVFPSPHHPQLFRPITLGAATPLFDQANVDLAVVGPSVWVSSPSANRVFETHEVE